MSKLLTWQVVAYDVLGGFVYDMVLSLRIET